MVLLRYHIIKICTRMKSLNLEIFFNELAFILNLQGCKIDHGNNYFEFFNRLGEFHYIAIVGDNRIIGGAAGIKRKISNKNGQYLDVWYLCDLKIMKEYQGKKLSFEIAKKGLEIMHAKDKFYMITMYPTSKKIEKMSEYFGFLNIKNNGYLYIYQLEYEAMKMAEKILQKFRGPTARYVKSEDVGKNIILKSSGEKMKLAHLQFKNNCNEGKQLEDGNPMENYIHMFCLYQNDKLIEELRKAGIRYSSKALILSRHMTNFDWNFIATSDI